MSCLFSFCFKSKRPKDDSNVIEDNHVQHNAMAMEYESSKADQAAAHTEIQHLRKELSEFQELVSEQELHVKQLHEQGNEILCEIINLKMENDDLKQEIKLQREYSRKEKSELEHELKSIKRKLEKRNDMVEEIFEQNKQLTNKKESINERIYMVGIKYMNLRKDMID